MYAKTYPLYGLEKTVTIPIVRKVAIDIMNLFNISPDTLINNHIMSSDDVNNRYSLANKSRRYVDLATTSLSMDYDEIMSPTDLSTVKLQGNNTKPILYSYSNFKVQSLTIPTELDITFKLESKNKSEVSRLLNGLRFSFISQSSVNTHEAMVRYYPPSEILTFMSDLHKQLNTKYQKELPIEDFIKLFKSDSLQLAKPINGDLSKASLVVEYASTNMLGVLEDMDSKEIDYDKETGTYFIDIKYKVSYDKPTYLNMSYQPIIQNMVLKDKYLNKTTTINNDQYIKSKTNYLRGDTSSVLRTLDLLIGDKPFINIPTFDNFRTPSNIGTTVLSILVVLDQSKELFNLNNLGDLSINPMLIDFMITDKENIFEPYESLFFIELQEDDKTVLNRLSIDDNGLLSIDEFKDSSRYRVLLNVNDQPRTLRSSVTDKLLKVYKDLNNRKLFTSRNTTRILNSLNIPEETLVNIENLINPNDIDDLHLFNDSNYLTVLNSDIDNILNTLLDNETYMNNIPLSDSNLDGEQIVLELLKNTYILQGYSIPNLIASLLKNTVMVAVGNDTFGGQTKIIKSSSTSIIDINNDFLKVRIIMDENIVLILKDELLYALEDNKLVSLTNLSRFTEYFKGYVTKINPGQDSSLERTVMVSNILSLGYKELKIKKKGL